MMDALIDGFQAVFLTHEQVELYGGLLDAMESLGAIIICSPLAIYDVLSISDPKVPFFRECGHA